MKHKYKIQVDQPVPSDDQIGRHKDFGRILADYHNLTQPIYRKPLYKNPKAFLGLALILTIGALVFIAVDEEDKKNEQDQEVVGMPMEVQLAEVSSFLHAPLPALNIPKMALQVNSDTPQSVDGPNGIKMVFPAHPFQAADGSPVDGPVDLRIRAATHPAELIAMGLPTELGHEVISPGLVLQVEASQNGKPLQLNPAQPIAIDWTLPVGMAHAMRPFYLDTTSRKWGTVGPDVYEPSPITSLKAHHDDGFGVVEYDRHGKVIPKANPNAKGGEGIKHMEFPMVKLGIVCLGEENGRPSGSLRRTVRFTDEKGQPLRILTLYGITKGRRAVEFLWPRSAEYAFELEIGPGTVQNYIALLPDGRVASVMDARPKPEKTLQVMQMKISDEPVQNIAALTQLFDQLAGL